LIQNTLTLKAVHAIKISVVLSSKVNNCLSCRYIGLDREHVEKAEASYMSERDERCAEFLTKKNLLSEEMSSLQVNYLITVYTSGHEKTF